MFRLKERKWSNGDIDYCVVCDDTAYEHPVTYRFHSKDSYLEQAKRFLDTLNKVVVSEKIVYP